MRDRRRYLFVRILEACNADCFMCEFALSRDTYRFTVQDFAELLPEAVRAGVGYVRFTGGEPLMHRDVVELVRLGTEHGMRMSLITNGMFLPRFVDRLADTGSRPALRILTAARPGLESQAARRYIAAHLTEAETLTREACAPPRSPWKPSSGRSSSSAARC
ncbi:radical SAM protein [Streptomyces sp. F63]|uniref:radical SAM protein n=1 Tax=Streptomyces sp. F63 TaxID=2824887 RepID=UPI001B35DEEA|nr:radical SAM protein [Streptomyces sp. F63]MBQ0986314.1 radical SAM protein [Streptomyces sp. F63]